jgi:hypothetical protein
LKRLLDAEPVADVPDAAQLARDGCGQFLLVLAADVAAERNDAVFGIHLDIAVLDPVGEF